MRIQSPESKSEVNMKIHIFAKKLVGETFLITWSTILILIYSAALTFAQDFSAKEEAMENLKESSSCADIFQGAEYHSLDDDQLLRLHVGDLGDRLVGGKCSEQTIRQYYQARSWKFVNSGARSHVSGGPTGDADYYFLLSLPHYFFLRWLGRGRANARYYLKDGKIFHIETGISK